MMYRRPQFDKVNPRNVAPSRHAIFVRGLPGSTDISRVKEFFSNEGGVKCSVDFFSTSEDKKRFSVAIRFKSHSMAREMLTRFNGKSIMGYPVEVTWFKDLKKARAKMFEEQRQSGVNRPYFRQNFRGNFRGGADRRGQTSSPGDVGDGPGYRSGRAGRYSRSRSRSYSGSSSRSASASPDSRSSSPSRDRRQPARSSSGGREYSHEHKLSSTKDKRSRKHSKQSLSPSTSSSRSSSNADHKFRSAERPGASGAYKNQNRPSPMAYTQTREGGSPEHSTMAAYSNLPAPDADAGSSLVSGLIQLKRRKQPHQMPLNRVVEPFSHVHSSVNSAASSPRAMDGSPPVIMHRPRVKRLYSISPPSIPPGVTLSKTTTSRHDASPHEADFEGTTSTKRQKARRMERSPGAHRASSVDHPDTNRESATKRHNGEVGSTQIHGTANRSPLSTLSRGRTDKWQEETVPVAEDAWSRIPRREGREDVGRGKRTRRRSPSSPDDQDDSSDSALSEYTKNDAPKPEKHRSPKNESGRRESVSETAAASRENRTSTLDVIRKRKEDLTEEYQRDCETFTTVVRTLISKDGELESRLMSLLKEILHERGQRCIEELRSFISEHQPGGAGETKEQLMEAVNDT